MYAVVGRYIRFVDLILSRYRIAVGYIEGYILVGLLVLNIEIGIVIRVVYLYIGKSVEKLKRNVLNTV